MKMLRTNNRLIGSVLLGLFLVQVIGCTSFVPLGENLPPQNDSKINARLRVTGRDQAVYAFHANQYTVKYNTDSTIAQVRGWGDKYTSFGLVDQGYFELTTAQIKSAEVEKLTTGRVALIAGAVVGLSVLTYLGVKAVGGDATSGRGRSEGPAEGN